MSPGEVVLALLRRWYVLLIAALLTVLAAHQVLRPQASWASSSVIVLKPPVTGNQPNQLANLQPPLAAVSYAIIQQLDSPAGKSELRAAGVLGTYSLVPRNSGTSVTPQYLIPSLQIQAVRPAAALADTDVYLIISVYRRHLDTLQGAQHIPADSRMSVDLLVPPNSVLQTGTKSRALAGVGLTGLFCGVLLALWTDRRLRPDRPGDRPGDQPADQPVDRPQLGPAHTAPAVN
ncbi:hypothetical protein [Streptomyces sp. NBC_01190]|uniref:hypothetical protein n=1 Tax=Streptomyces sp. NBC_01190 TaxID=2903767 RepID=UPI0038684C8F|nr:hypothetical protein OG519_03305 [Streptomyces sp. NBC_01190]